MNEYFFVRKKNQISYTSVTLMYCFTLNNFLLKNCFTKVIIQLKVYILYIFSMSFVFLFGIFISPSFYININLFDFFK